MMLLSHQCHALASAGPLGPYLLSTHILVNILVKSNLKYKDINHVSGQYVLSTVS